jgi:hypothetical protein
MDDFIDLRISGKCADHIRKFTAMSFTTHSGDEMAEVALRIAVRMISALEEAEEHNPAVGEFSE